MPEEHIPSLPLEEMTLGEPFRQDHGIVCCPAIHNETGAHFVVRTIQIPADPEQANALLYSGACADETQVREYFAEKANNIVAQTKLLEKLSEEGFCPFHSCRIIADEELPIFRVELIRPYLETPLPSASDVNWTVAGALELGINLCKSLDMCRKAGYLYVNLRPENLFMNEDGEHCITDLGFMRLDSLAYASVPAPCRSDYTPPEIENAYSCVTPTLDTYAVGTLLYSIFSGGVLPDKQAPVAPLYADYALWPILQSACNADPNERFSDPLSLMQALQAYLDQHADSAAAVIYTEPPVTETAQSVVTFLTEEENEAMLASLLAVIPDEQMPENLPQTISDTPEGADDLAKMLEMADALINHELPQPVVVPTPGDFTIVPPTVAQVSPAPEEEASPVIVPTVIQPTEPGETASTPADNEPAEDAEPKKRKRLSEVGAVITAACVVIVLGILIGAGIFFYQNFYLQTVDGITISASADRATVHISSGIDEDLLMLVCTDAYGNTQKAAISGGKAIISGLNPSTHYQLSLEISGFHKLTGVTAASFNTEGLTQIQNFSAICGQISGSAILSFSTTGQDSPWIVEYYADGEPKRQVSFTGTTVTVNGLTVGKEYTFDLIPENGISLAGQTQLKYTAQAVIVAGDLRPMPTAPGSIRVVWDPQGYIGKWQVRCYDGTDYDRTITVAEPEAIFDGIDTTKSYTVLVTAEGMSRSESISITADPITVTSVGFTEKNKSLLFVWVFSGTAPEDGWTVTYSINGETAVAVSAGNPSVELPLTKGASYTITLNANTDRTLISETYLHTV